MSRGICGIWQWLTRNLANLDDARRCIDDAIDKVEKSNEKCWEPEVIALPGKSPSNTPDRMR